VSEEVGGFVAVCLATNMTAPATNGPHHYYSHAYEVMMLLTLHIGSLALGLLLFQQAL